MSEKILDCPCGKKPELVDDRLVFFVRCENHQPPWPVVYGDSYRHIDHIEDEAEAQDEIDSVDWEAAKKSAVLAWNKWVKEISSIEAAGLKVKP